MIGSWRRRAEDCLQDIWRTRGPASTLLSPFSWLYGRLSARRLARHAGQAWRAPVPVIVVGNILVGGTGKTPVTAAVCHFLLARGWRPGILSRGYGTRPGASARLSDQSGGSAHLGDEPALLHALTGAPVAVHPQRALAAIALLQAHPDIDVLIADDGLQHTALARDVEIIVQDARGIGNGRLLPAGPLREPPDRRRHADWLITQLGPDDVPPDSVPTDIDGRPRQLHLHLQPDTLTHLASGQQQDWASWRAAQGQTPCSAAAGIGQPQRFFAMLRLAGLALTQTLSSPDHQAPSPDDLRALPPGPILITAKDAVKYAPPYDPRLWTVHAIPAFSDPAWLDTLETRLQALRAALPHKQGIRH
ncbi:tetraacyldisaccharide 4'-kinase [Castellaniella sp.]|uniref:tetraacyldisaccharide 4'-kinase n=1 Tax=Castellaniella sp. TaxID=1955812 RepID=UPI002AFEC474|nr:tetraacyldisaccharide 4'-kinase [Castellaniella sp.]